MSCTHPHQRRIGSHEAIEIAEMLAPYPDLFAGLLEYLPEDTIRGLRILLRSRIAAQRLHSSSEILNAIRFLSDVKQKFADRPEIFTRFVHALHEVRHGRFVALFSPECDE